MHAQDRPWEALARWAFFQAVTDTGLRLQLHLTWPLPYPFCIRPERTVKSQVGRWFPRESRLVQAGYGALCQ